MEKIDIRKQIEDKNLKWYALSVVSGQESLVIENLKERIKKQSLGDEIVDFLFPTIPEVHYKNNKKVISQRKLFPGYVFIKSKMNEKIWYVIRNTPGVRLIVGAEVTPIPLTEAEYQDIIRQINEKTQKVEFAVPFKAGDIVHIKDGEFNGMKGKVTDVDMNKGFLYVNIEILGRNTPIIVSLDKVDFVD